MDFRYTPQEQQFRLEVRKFIAEHCPRELKGFHEIHAEHVPLEMAFLKKMADRGWLGAAFPKEYGGLGGERMPMVEYILIDELHHAGGQPRVAVALRCGNAQPARLAERQAVEAFAQAAGQRGERQFARQA